MREYHTLYHHPETGYIIQYVESRKLLMGYSVLKIEFFEDEFAGFRNCLQYLTDKFAGHSDPTLKNIFIPTPAPALEIALSYRELLELRSVVDSADSEMKALEMMAALHSGS